jgi:hypothetical protein
MLFTTISYGYALYYHRYNGDYWGMEVTLTQGQLFLSYIVSLLPFVGLWVVYEYFKRKPIKKRQVKIPMLFFRQFLCVVFFASLAATLLYGVGKMANPPYQAPFFVKFFIVILNRFPLTYLASLFILLSNSKINIITIAVMTIILGVVRAGLGVFLFLGLAFLLKYYTQLFHYVRKRLILTVFVVIISPFLIQQLYNIRASLRSGEAKIEERENLIAGKLCGRLSSFANLCFIQENENYFRKRSYELGNWFVQQPVASAVVGNSVDPLLNPGKMMIEASGGNSKNVLFMCGTPGILLLSYYKSPHLALLNLLTIMALVVCAFKVSRCFKTPFANEIAVLFMVTPILSGVSKEFAFLTFILLLFLMLICVVKGYNKKLSEK